MEKITLSSKIIEPSIIGILFQSSGPMSGMEVARELNSVLSKDASIKLIDWHQASDILDNLNTRGISKRVGQNNSGMCLYTICK